MKKAIKILALAAALIGTTALMCGVTASAYIDPSVMTYLIQAIAGVVIAVGAAVGIYFRRAKKKLNDKLGIDENAGKEVESDDIVVAAEDEEKKD